MTFPLQLGAKGDAVFDAERNNRFLLRRTWAPSLPMLGICMLNPSKAGENEDDNSVRKVQSYARLWGFGGVAVVNAFSWCSTDPKQLPRREETQATIDSNFRFIMEAADSCQMFLCAWGRGATLDSRYKHVLALLRHIDLYCLRLTKDGHPEHPLYLPSKIKPIPYEPVFGRQSA